MAGAIYSYGNARTSPYNEQFYIGGANSIRAFTIRSIGPGRYYQNSDNNKYAYIDVRVILNSRPTSNTASRSLATCMGPLSSTAVTSG